MDWRSCCATEEVRWFQTDFVKVEVNLSRAAWQVLKCTQGRQAGRQSKRNREGVMRVWRRQSFVG